MVLPDLARWTACLDIMRRPIKTAALRTLSAALMP